MARFSRWWLGLPVILGSFVAAEYVLGDPAPGQTTSAASRKQTSRRVIHHRTGARKARLTAPDTEAPSNAPDEKSSPAVSTGGTTESDLFAPLPLEAQTVEETPTFDASAPIQPTAGRRIAQNSRNTGIPAPGPQRGINITPTPPAPTYTTYLGSQTPSISVDWVTPATIMVGQEGSYELVLQNPGRVAVEQLVIEQVLPKGFRLVAASPEPAESGADPVWRIARLEPQDETRVTLRLIPEVPGEAKSEARVSLTTFSTAAFQVVEPKLDITVEAPETVILGNQAIFTVTVHNPGTGPATNAKLAVQLPEGLSYVADDNSYDLGTINSDEARSIQVLADVQAVGDHRCTFVATADMGLRDEDQKQVRALGARLELAIEGPTFRYVTRPARYTLRLKNTGTASAQNLRLRATIPASFAFLDADRSGRFDAASNTVNWFLGQLNAGEEIDIECGLRAMDKGNFPILGQASAERGLRADAQQNTQVEGIAAILLEVVDVDDPVEVGAETFYEIVITNQGTNFANNVQIIAEAPEGVKLLGSKGPTEGKITGQTLKFDVLPRLAPRADAIYRIMVRGVEAGDFRMKVQATSDTLEEPVMELESTKIYRD